MLPGVFLFELMHLRSARFTTLSNTQYCRASLVTKTAGHLSMIKHRAEDFLSMYVFKINKGNPSPHQPPSPATSTTISCLPAAVLLLPPKNHLGHTDIDVAQKKEKNTWWGRSRREARAVSLKSCTLCACSPSTPWTVYTALYCPRTQAWRQLGSAAALNTHRSF